MKTVKFLVDGVLVNLAMDCLAPWAVGVLQLLSNADRQVGLSAEELLAALMNKVGLLDVGNEKTAMSVLLGRMKKAGVIRNVAGSCQRYVRSDVSISLAI